MSQVVEIRFDCEPHDLTPEQVRGLLEAHDDELNLDVGLGFEGKAAVTFDLEDGSNGETWAETVAGTARSLGLTVVDTEVLSEEEYTNRAWGEVEVDPNG